LEKANGGKQPPRSYSEFTSYQLLWIRLNWEYWKKIENEWKDENC
jgi:hypothetical protein